MIATLKYLPPQGVVLGTLTQSCFHSLRADHTVWIRDSYRAEQIIHCDLPILPEGLSKPRRWKRMGGKMWHLMKKTKQCFKSHLHIHI